MKLRLRLIPGIPTLRMPEFAALSKEDKKKVRTLASKKQIGDWRFFVALLATVAVAFLLIVSLIFERVRSEELIKENAALQQSIQNWERARSATTGSAAPVLSKPEATNRGWMESMLRSPVGLAFRYLIYTYLFVMAIEYIFLDSDLDRTRQAMQELGLPATET